MYTAGDSHCDEYSTYNICCSLVWRSQIPRKYVSVAQCVALNIAESHSCSIFGERTMFFLVTESSVNLGWMLFTVVMNDVYWLRE